MIRILDDTKTLTALASDTSNGVGVIQNIDGTTREQLNGAKEAEFTVAITEKYFSELHVGGIVRIADTGGDQMYRIYKITKPINQVCTVYCEHITYDLTKTSVTPFSATGASASVSALMSHASTNEFNITTDIANSSSTFTLRYPRTFRECLGGYEGSLLDVFRGEYEWDNLTVRMLASRGADNGVRISYGKNLTDFRQEENNASTYTAVLGYAIVNEVEYHGDIYHKIAATNPRVKIVDFSSNFEMDEVPTTQELTDLAQAYATNNDIEVPKVSITVAFVPLHQTEEYKNIAPLERVSLGDTVHVYFDRLGVEATARVIETVWNINGQRYDSVSLGDAKATLNSLINSAVQTSNDNVTRATGFLESEMNQMASIIINGLGLHRTLVPTSDGGYRIYLHNKETLALSDTQYVFTSAGFMVSTDYGQTWNAGFDSSGNAVVNSLSTIVLRALEIYGSRITFGDENDKYITAGVYVDSNNNPVGVSFDGSGYARFQPHETFQVKNLDSNNGTLNNFQMRSVGYSGGNAGGSDILMTNYNSDHSVANQLWLANDVGGANYNYSYLGNRDMSGNVGNTITLSAGSSSNVERITNLIVGAASTANVIVLEANQNTNRIGVSNYDLSGIEANSLDMRATSTLRRTSLANKSPSDAIYDAATLEIWTDTTSTPSANINLVAKQPSNHMTGANVQVMSLDGNDGSVSINAWDASGAGGTTSLLVDGDGEIALFCDSITINNKAQFAMCYGTSASVTCGANNSGSTTASVTIPSGYKAIAVACVKSNGDVVPAYTSATVFGMTGAQTLNLWWHNGTNSAKTCTFTIELLCAVNV